MNGPRSAAVLLLLLLCACTGGGKADKDRPVLASVNGVPIYLDAFKREMQRLSFDDDEGGGPPPVAAEQAQRRALLENLIERRLVLQEAERFNVLVGIEDVEAAYGRTRAGWDEAEIDGLLQRKDVTQAELKREIRELLLIHKYFSQHVYSRVAVTDEEILDYVRDHPEAQVVPGQVHALQIVVKTEEKASSILAEIKKGLAFEEAAMKYSLSPEAKSGGDLGFFARGSMPRVFDEVCFSLKAGAVSNVVASDYGHHLFKVMESRPESLKPVEQVRDEIERKLRRDKEQQAQGAKLEELRKAAKIVIHEKTLARAL